MNERPEKEKDVPLVKEDGWGLWALIASIVHVFLLPWLTMTIIGCVIVGFLVLKSLKSIDKKLGFYAMIISAFVTCIGIYIHHDCALNPVI